MTKSLLQADIMVENSDWGDVESIIDHCFESVTNSDFNGFTPGKIVFLFTSDAQVQELNASFRSQEKATNVLSFPAGPAMPGMPPEEAAVIGDIALAFETCAREAAELEISLTDHISHLIVHGILHLFGYHHIEDEEAEIMESLEIKLLADMGIKNPYAGMESING